MEANIIPKSMRNGIQRLPKKLSKKGYPKIAKMCAQGSPADHPYSFKCGIFLAFFEILCQDGSLEGLELHLDLTWTRFWSHF